MVDKENPPSENSQVSDGPVEAICLSDSSLPSENNSNLETYSGVVTAILVNGSLPISESFSPDNLAARGGAVASVVLGIWSIAGASITSYSVVNAVLGLALGCWGMSSNVRWPWLGPVLSMAGIAICATVAAVN